MNPQYAPRGPTQIYQTLYQLQVKREPLNAGPYAYILTCASHAQTFTSPNGTNLLPNKVLKSQVLDSRADDSERNTCQPRLSPSIYLNICEPCSNTQQTHILRNAERIYWVSKNIKHKTKQPKIQVKDEFFFVQETAQNVVTDHKEQKMEDD